MKDKYRNRFGTLIIALAMAALAMAGCSGGTAGPAGPAGLQGAKGPTGPAGSPVVNAATLTPEQAETFTMTGTVTSVTITSPPVVTFWLKDANGYGIINMGTKNAAGTALNNLRFALAKLVPGAKGSPDQWVSYMVTDTSRPTTENTGTLVDNGDGSYTYTFAKDVTDPTQTGGVTFEPNLTHRLAIQCSGTLPGGTNTISNPANIIYDFIPATGNPVTAADTQREIVAISACNECHGKLALHGGSRIDTKFCVVCHTDQRRIGRTEATTDASGNFPPITYDETGRVNSTPGTYIVDDRAIGNFPNYIHKIHMGQKLTKQNYNFGRFLFNEVTFPQDQRNCRKCHKGDTAEQLAVTPQGNNWKTKPSRLACGACHDDVNFATGANHAGGARTDDSFCALCHDALSIETKHTTPNATPKNPNVPDGAVNFIYEISSVTVNASSQPVVKFRIKSYTGSYSDAAVAGATPVTFNAFAAGATLFTGFTGGPGFIVGWGLPQDGVTTVVDYNNRGNTSPQGVSVSLTNVWNGTQGALTGPDADGFYTATLDGSSGAARFPAGATLRTVALQSYFSQAAGTNGITVNTARHAKSVVGYVTGETRRSVVDPDKCAKCHEWLELHGGSRVSNPQVCVICHNPNLSSSGRGADPATVLTRMSAAGQAEMTADGFNPADPLSFPEDGMHFKNLIHSIHSSHFRAAPFQFVRDRGSSGVYYYDFSEVTFPGILNNCETCHRPNTASVGYDKVPSGALATTVRTTGVADGNDASSAAVLAARATVPNTGTDWVNSPFAGSCFPCHNNAPAKAHMEASGGKIAVLRANNLETSEQCAVCHSAGRVADINVVHKKK